jgi:chorismate mutase
MSDAEANQSETPIIDVTSELLDDIVNKNSLNIKEEVNIQSLPLRVYLDQTVIPVLVEGKNI